MKIIKRLKTMLKCKKHEFTIHIYCYHTGLYMYSKCIYCGKKKTIL
jgi:hypothetical protein